MSFIAGNPQDPFYFDLEPAKELGKDLAPKYASADPFPHAVIDDFLPQPVIDYCIEHFPIELDPDSTEFDRHQERKKRSFHPDHLAPKLRGLFYAFNSLPFIKLVENITGISGLIPDPYFSGAGFHEIRTGGHLSIHADFNHHRPLNLERRVNVLIYLNRQWADEFGGQLELWTPDMKRKVHSIVPVANRCVMFTTTGQSMHGNPQPVAHPDGVPRRSIALYYYTSTWDESKAAKTTQFRVRPGTLDKVDWTVKGDEFIEDFVPPIVARRLLKVKHRLGL